MPWRLEQYVSICMCVLYFLKQESTGQKKCIVHHSQLKNCQQLVFFNRHYAFSVTIKPCDDSASQQIVVQLICKFPKASGRMPVHGIAIRMGKCSGCLSLPSAIWTPFFIKLFLVFLQSPPNYFKR